MQRIVIKNWDNSIVELVFVGWNSKHQSVYVLRDDYRTVLDLKLPFVPGPGDLKFSFPDAAPVSIHKARLIPPRCCANESAAKFLLKQSNLSSSVLGNAPFKKIKETVLYPRISDHPELRKRLQQFTTAMRSEYLERKRCVQTLTKDDVRLELCGNKSDTPLSDAEFEKYINDKLKQLEEIYKAAPRPFYGLTFAGYLNYDLKMVINDNVAGIRDAYLHEQWAKLHGFDLARMAREKNQYLQVLEKCAGTSPGNNLLDPVEYEICFADGSKFWLSGFELRDLHSAKEVDEFEKCLGSKKLLRRIHVPLPQALATLKRTLKTLKKHCHNLHLDPEKLTVEDVQKLGEAMQRKRPDVAKRNRKNTGARL